MPNTATSRIGLWRNDSVRIASYDRNDYDRNGVLAVWTLIFLFFAVCWIAKLVTAPVRSASSLKRIEEELKSKR
jgi:hypothetical protein